jgi:hypothetical protein
MKRFVIVFDILVLPVNEGEAKKAEPAAAFIKKLG